MKGDEVTLVLQRLRRHWPGITSTRDVNALSEQLADVAVADVLAALDAMAAEGRPRPTPSQVVWRLQRAAAKTDFSITDVLATGVDLGAEPSVPLRDMARVWRHIAARYPQARDRWGDAHLREAWGRSLQRFDDEDLIAAVDELSEESDWFPRTVAPIVRAAGDRQAFRLAEERRAAAGDQEEERPPDPVSLEEMTKAYLRGLHDTIYEETERARWAGATAEDLAMVPVRVRNRWRKLLPRLADVLGPEEDETAPPETGEASAKGAA